MRELEKFKFLSSKPNLYFSSIKEIKLLFILRENPLKIKFKFDFTMRAICFPFGKVRRTFSAVRPISTHIRKCMIWLSAVLDIAPKLQNSVFKIKAPSKIYF